MGDIRECPVCGLLWGKWEGCDGSTTCGARPSTREIRGGVYHGFEFARTPKFTMLEKPKKLYDFTERNKNKGRGCGATITWSSMKPVNQGCTKDSHGKDTQWTMAELRGLNMDAGITTMNVPALGQPVNNRPCQAQLSFEEIYQAALQRTLGCSTEERTQCMLEE